MQNLIKTIELENKSNEEIDFVLKHMEDLYDQNNSIVDLPHRHSYYTIVAVKKGTGTHTIDFKSFLIKNYSIHFVYPGQIHQFVTSSRPNGWVMNFSPEFILQNNIAQDIINSVYLYNTSGDSPPLNVTETEFESFENIIRQIQTYSNKNIVFKYEALGALLKLFFINTTSICSFQKNDTLNNAIGINHLLVNFKNCIEKQYKTTHKVTDYAYKLNVSSDYLNKNIKAQTGKSAKEFIQERVVLEAKRMLLFTNKSNKELAYQLGFEEPAHFNNFFKKLTGYTPGKFREKSSINNI